MGDELGDRLKDYERQESARRLTAGLPICARIDGKRFSRFTGGLRRPCDERLNRLMVATTQHLVEESEALAGYTQSDEISLLYHGDDAKTQLFLDRRVQKMTSILASMTTAYFNAHLAEHLPEKSGAMALFDCRVFSVPNKDEAANVFLWRELDATKNSVNMAARVYYAHDELHNRSGSELLDLLMQKGIDWNDYPSFFKRGTFILRHSATRSFTAEDRAALPPKHEARQNPDLVVTRSIVRPAQLPPFGRIQNRVGVLFHGEAPRLADPHEKPARAQRP